jgi:serine/threonine-protein kinase
MEGPVVTFGQYELVRRLARGGMAEIFLAIERGMEGVERQVVLKRIVPHMAEAEDFIAMFLDEARVAARFSHPNIAHVYNFGEVQGVYFMAMEYVDGMTLSALMRQCRPGLIPVEIALRVVADVCAGLHHAHETRDLRDQLLGVVHRDVSPQNVMVSRAGAAKLLDFGVARASTQSHSTRAGQLKGKLGYIAPEQFHNQPLDRRADVFSAGVVLHELLSGTRAFVRETEAATVNAILHDDVPPLPAQAALPAGLEEVIGRALAKDPAHRYATALEMQAALEHLIGAAGITVSPFTVGQFVSAKMAEAAAHRAPTPERTGADDRSAEPGGDAVIALGPAPEPETETTDPSIPPPDILGSVEGLETVATSPMHTSHPSYEPSSVTPSPASDVPTRSSFGWIFIALVGGLLVVFGVAAGVVTVGRLWRSTEDRGSRDDSAAAASSTEVVSIAGGPATVVAAPLPEAGVAPVAVIPPAGLDGGSTTDAQVSEQVWSDTDGGTATDAPAPEPVHDAGTAAPPGRLYLHTNPWSKVRIGGRSYGSTPLMGVPLPAGRHTVTLVDAEGRRLSRRIDIRQGSATKIFIDMGEVAQ